VTQILRLPPGAFRPVPKVHSAVVRLTFGPSRVPHELESVLTAMVKTMFMQRRKTLANALRPFAGDGTPAALTAAGIDPIRRPETLDLAELIRLAERLKPNS
jgi:16S rRNA (adenine1518-N6/adenine1519-N6)-dimethyltransferase